MASESRFVVSHHIDNAYRVVDMGVAGDGMPAVVAIYSAIYPTSRRAAERYAERLEKE